MSDDTPDIPNTISADDLATGWEAAAAEIKADLDRAEKEATKAQKAESVAELRYIEVGHRLIAMRAALKLKKTTTFKAFCAAIGISVARAGELTRLAQGKTTLTEQRARTAARVRKSRAQAAENAVTNGAVTAKRPSLKAEVARLTALLEERQTVAAAPSHEAFFAYARALPPAERGPLAFSLLADVPVMERMSSMLPHLTPDEALELSGALNARIDAFTATTGNEATAIH